MAVNGVYTLARFRRLVARVGLILLAAHFLLIFLFLSPREHLPRLVSRAADMYVIPVFYQYWQLFAPEPPVASNRLFFRCQFESGSWSRWTDPGYHLLLNHYNNRFSYWGKLHDVYESIGHNLYHEYYAIATSKAIAVLPDGEWQPAADERLSKTAAYALAKRYFADQAAIAHPGKQVVVIEFMRVSFYVPPWEMRDSPDAKREVKLLRFKPFDVHVEED